MDLPFHNPTRPCGLPTSTVSHRAFSESSKSTVLPDYDPDHDPHPHRNAVRDFNSKDTVGFNEGQYNFCTYLPGRAQLLGLSQSRQMKQKRIKSNLVVLQAVRAMRALRARARTPCCEHLRQKQPTPH